MYLEKMINVVYNIDNSMYIKRKELVPLMELK